MLKIKDDIDLKELEKYGFDTRASTKVNGFNIDFTDRWVDDNFGTIVGNGLYIWDGSRKICECGMPNAERRLDTLYSLIEAGLVEKVEEGDLEND